jgi:phosphatidylglycerophosphate synthase
VWRTWANGLTALRLIAAPACAWSIANDAFDVALGMFVIAVATDFVDGRVARYRGEVSSFGGLLDHLTDAIFVSLALAALALRELAPAPLPFLVAAAFAQYTLDSRALAGAPLRASTLGRWNGVLYFVIAGVAIAREALPLGFPPTGWLLAAGYALVISTLLSMLDRAVALVRR